MADFSMPDFDLIAQYYDLIYADRTEDVSMWLALAEKMGGPLLEVGCGTGRILLPLAQAGQAITGLDLSERALEAAGTKLKTLGPDPRVTLVQADMRDFVLAQRNFAQAFIPGNTFMHCTTRADQLACLRAVQAHLAPGGRLVVDVYHPTPDLLGESDGRLHFAGELVDEVTGHRVHWFYGRQVRIDTQLQEVTFLLDELDSAGLVHRRTLTFPMRYVHRFEMELLLQTSGYELVEIYGDYDLATFEAESPRMIFVAKRTVS